MISLTPLCEILPKHYQVCTPYCKASRNIFQALVDPLNDGNNISFDGGDGKPNASNNSTIGNVPPHDSGLPASLESPDKPPAIQQWLWEVQDFILDMYPIEGLIPLGILQILKVSAATHILLVKIRHHNIVEHTNTEKHLYKIEERVIALQAN
jgi:hypothetical protein